MKVFNGIDELEKAVGTHLGYSPWHTVTQQRIDLFADATGDHQWIHVDPEKAAAGPFGTTIAHGYLTLSLIPRLAGQVYRVDGLAMSVNYGCDKVRFPSPVPTGSRVRAGVELLSLASGPKGVRSTSRVTVEREGADKPVCVAETVSVMVP
ncbi:MaoC family dehydratase [Streptomyces viridosporus]|uniref:MaoC family dehydratase n=1 Tax=Streptomyces viridosporus T7A TaxID=665577 RepID=A0ABX6A909_STRVD|nr:MaoC family dehydratase [Streptomyces viridosporus]QEU83970.1 MaoC family dehydratase [Streptomyces viridosporus T7A]